MRLICVYGSVSDKINDKFKQAGIDLGKKIAERNYGLVYSGMKGGISGAVAKGVSMKSNLPIIGVMPDFFKETRANEMFERCTEKIFTDNMTSRKEVMKQKSDVIIIAPGGIGTLNELFDAICTNGLGLMDKPIVIYNIDNYYKKIIEMLDYAIETNFVRENYKEIFKIFDDLDEMFNYIDNYEQGDAAIV